MRFSNPVRSITVVAFNKKIADEISTRLGNPRLLPPSSVEQTAIADLVASRDNHVVVAALAGTGKTTTIEQIVSRFPGSQANACTLHSLGFAALRDYLKGRKIWPKVDDKKVSTIVDSIIGADYYGNKRDDMYECVGAITRLVSLCKSQGFLAHLPAPSNTDLSALADKYDVDFDPSLSDDVYNCTRKALIANNSQLRVIDFDDMIYLAVALKCRFNPPDLMMVDESQDLNPIQIEMVRMVASSGKTQLVFVGDEFQAIYGFRGADVDAMETIKSTFGTTSLPLTVCRRCSKAVIAAAQRIVPDIRARDDAPDGAERSLESWDKLIGEVTADDIVVCRTTAPLVDLCFRFIRLGRNAFVLGREIGKGLEALIKKISKSRVARGKSVLDGLDAYKNNQLTNMKTEKQQAFLDRMETLEVLAEGCADWSCLVDKIGDIFKDSGNGIMLCTGHKSKGLEARNCYVICPEKMPHPMAVLPWQRKQEMNLKYVATTRAKHDIVWVHRESDPDKPKTNQRELS